MADEFAKKHDDFETPGLSGTRGRRVYFVRHGMTDWNKQFRYQGSTDIPLCEEGERQAQRAARRLARLGAVRIVSSPLRRSLRTAEILAAELGSPKVEVWPELTEVDFGGWEGLTVAQIKARYGDESFEKWRSEQLDVTAPEGEDVAHAYERAQSAAGKLLGAEDKSMIVVGHGAFFRVLMLPIIRMPKCSLFWRMRLDNCSISAFDVDKQKRASVTYLNDTLHMLTPFSDIADLPLA